MTDFKVRYSLSCMCMHRPTHTSLPLYHTLHLLCSHYKWFKPGCKLQHSHRLCNKQFNTCRLMSESVKIYVCLLWHAILCTDVNQSINQSNNEITNKGQTITGLPAPAVWWLNGRMCMWVCVYVCVCAFLSNQLSQHTQAFSNQYEPLFRRQAGESVISVYHCYMRLPLSAQPITTIQTKHVKHKNNNETLN